MNVLIDSCIKGDVVVEQELIRKIENKTAVIGVVGLGYVGLPLALRFTETGFRVIGFDIDSDKIKALDAGRSYIKHIPSERIGRAVTEKTLAVTTDFVRAKEADALIICVPTPLNKHREPDLSFVIETTKSLAPYLRGAQVVSLESTAYPGTTEEEIKPVIERRGLVVGKVMDSLNNAGKPLQGSRVLVLRIAYKKNVDDMRESPSVELMSILKNKGTIVTYSDPYVPQFPRMRKYSFDLDSVELAPEVLQQQDNQDIFCLSGRKTKIIQ